MDRLVLIDTANFLHRAFYAFPMQLTTADGQVINAVYGFASMLISLVKEFEPTHLACALESEEEIIFREVEFPEYKATRAPKSPEEQEAYESQIPFVGEFLEAAGIKTLKSEGYEADDVIGTVVAHVKGEVEVIIASNDRDLMQLIDGAARFYLPAVGKGKAKLYSKKEFVEDFGFNPDQLIEYKALRGDPSDNIPGVRGIGDKTATRLVKEYKTLDKVYESILDIAPAVAKKLADGKENAFLSRKLATIVTNAPLDFELKDLEFKGLNNPQVLDLFEKWGFKSLVTKLGASKEVEGDKSQLKLL